MAEKYEGTFVSKITLDQDRETKRSYLEQKLDKARSKYEREKKLKELQEQQGETTWMLPSLNKRLEKEKEKTEKKKKRKHDKKSKKHKKEKKHKKKHSKKDDSLDDSDDSSGDEWVEKPGEVDQGDKKDEDKLTVDKTNLQKITNDKDVSTQVELTASKREDWMVGDSFLDVVSNNAETIAEKRARREKEKREFMKPLAYEAGQHPKELNPFWKGGGTGVPNFPGRDEETNNSTRERITSGNAGSSWVKKAYQRAKEQAEEQGRRLEEVVSERFGSMERLEALLQAGDRKNRDDDGGRRGGWKKVNSTAAGDNKKRTESSNNKDIEGELPTSGWKKGLENDPVRSGTSTERSQASDKSLSAIKKVEEVHNRTSNERTAFEPEAADVEKGTSQVLSSSESDSEDSQSDEETEKPVVSKQLSEKCMNEIAAKILRAELMGNQELADQLKERLAAGKVGTSREKVSKEGPAHARGDEEVLLTRSDKHGNVYPLKVSGEEPEPRRKRRKTKKIETHDTKGNRLRYFQEDDRTDLQSMVEEERLATAEDHHSAIYARFSRKAGNPMGDDYTLDDMFEASSATKESQGDKDERNKRRAIAEHQRSMKQQASCRFCFDNPEVAKHLIISIATHVYLALPFTSSLTEGHCLIIPTQHTLASTYVDEDVAQEIFTFKQSLVKMFSEREEDVIFLETVKNFKRQSHMVIECIPVPKEVGDLAPIYFKKAIEESESEWSQNKKLVKVSKSRGIKGAMPKGLPYFAVEFGLDGGFAHVIEEEASFQHYFGKEIIGNVLDLEPVRWRKPHKESFLQQKCKVLRFSETWEPFDWTRDL